MNRKHLNDTADGVTRRTFLETGVAGSAALLGGGLLAAYLSSTSRGVDRRPDGSGCRPSRSCSRVRKP